MVLNEWQSGFTFSKLSNPVASTSIVCSSVWLITKERALGPKLSKKGMIVQELLMQAKSATAHSSLFLAKIPRKFHDLPSY